MNVLPTWTLINRPWWEDRGGIQARLYWDWCCSMREERQVKTSLAHSPKRESWFLNGWGEEWICGGQKGFAWSAHPLCGALCRYHAGYPAFAPRTSEVAVGSWPFCIFLFTVCATCSHMQLFLVSYRFFVFCCLRRCPGASTAIKGPKSQVPACLKWTITCILGPGTRYNDCWDLELFSFGAGMRTFLLL